MMNPEEKCDYMYFITGALYVNLVLSQIGPFLFFLQKHQFSVQTMTTALSFLGNTDEIYQQVRFNIT